MAFLSLSSPPILPSGMCGVQSQSPTVASWQAHLINIEGVSVVILSVVRLVPELPHPRVSRPALVPASRQRCRAIVQPSLFCQVRQYLQSQPQGQNCWSMTMSLPQHTTTREAVQRHHLDPLIVVSLLKTQESVAEACCPTLTIFWPKGLDEHNSGGQIVRKGCLASAANPAGALGVCRALA